MSRLTTLLVLLLTLFTCFAHAQTEKALPEFNGGFEQLSADSALPDNWIRWGNGNYLAKTDTVIKKSGYASLLIEAGPEQTNGSIASAAFRIPAQYKGKLLELKGYMKIDNVRDGVAGLVLRIDDSFETISLDNMFRRNIHGTADWTQYSVKLPYSEKARTIYVGVMLTGKGRVWADDLELLLDGKDIRNAGIVQPAIAGAEKDHQFDKGSGIVAAPLSPDNITDLALLGKVWGFLKYYHPAVANGEYNWDYELFRALSAILHCKNPAERNDALSKWIDRLGKVNARADVSNERAEIKLSPDLRWIDKKYLGDTLSAQLATIRDTKRTGDNYYISMHPNVGNPNFKNELHYATIKYPDAGFRLLCLYRYWNMIQYFFPYKNLLEEDWNNVLTEMIPTFFGAASELEYKKAALALIARVHDTHANIYSQEQALDTFWGVRFAPVKISFIENKPVVTGYYDTVLAGNTGLHRGDIIEAINNRNVEDIIKEQLPLTPASNYPTQLRNLSGRLLRTNDSVLSISYRRGNDVTTAAIHCYPRQQINYSAASKSIDTCFKIIAPGISYLNPDYLKNSYLPAIWPEMEKTKGLVIDFRSYPADFLVFTLSKYLQPEKTPFVKFSNGSVASPGLFTMQQNVFVGGSGKKTYKGKIVIIVNETTQSSAEYHTMAFRTAPGAVVIGSTTAGADGNVSEIILPGGIRTMISGIGVYYPDGKETQRIGIVPDVEVKPTIKGITEGKDELLDKAIAIIQQQ